MLKRAEFGCLKRVHTINVTNGCGLGCAYCYARGYSQAPPKGRVELYSNLPFLLQGELANPRRRGDPNLVVFNTASDCFQPHPDILEVTYRSMKTLIERGVSISFLTKGEIPPRFLELCGQWPERIMAQIGLVSLSDAYWQRFESGAAAPAVRLENIRSLSRMGIVPQVRMDPIIPFLTDNEREIEKVMMSIKGLGVKRVGLSYLHLRPGIMGQLGDELAPLHRNIIHTCFRNQPWAEVGTSTKTKLVSKPLRERGYGRIREIANAYGVDSVICSCKNPDITGGICVPERVIKGRSFQKVEKTDNQLTLFPC